MYLFEGVGAETRVDSTLNLVVERNCSVRYTIPQPVSCHDDGIAVVESQQLPFLVLGGRGVWGVGTPPFPLV